jgi:hypothetical protein
MGGRVVGDAPAVDGSAFGMAQLAGFIHSQMTPQADPNPPPAGSIEQLQVPLTRTAREALEKLAIEASTPDRSVTPMELAARLLEAAIASQGRAEQAEESKPAI